MLSGRRTKSIFFINSPSNDSVQPENVSGSRCIHREPALCCNLASFCSLFLHSLLGSDSVFPAETAVFLHSSSDSALVWSRPTPENNVSMFKMFQFLSDAGKVVYSLFMFACEPRAAALIFTQARFYKSRKPVSRCRAGSKLGISCSPGP